VTPIGQKIKTKLAGKSFAPFVLKKDSPMIIKGIRSIREKSFL